MADKRIRSDTHTHHFITENCEDYKLKSHPPALGDCVSLRRLMVKVLLRLVILNKGASDQASLY